jgi:hypothetical protein
MNRVLLLFLFSCSLASAQTRYIISVFDNDNDRLVNTVNSANGAINIVRNLNFPRQRLNAVAAILDDADLNRLRDRLDIQYQGNYLLAEDPPVIPNEGSGDLLGEPLESLPPTANPALDGFVPDRPIPDPLTSPLNGKIIVDIVGTGIDQSHPDLTDLTFEAPLSVMFASGPGFLPGDVDYHNHETRLAGCIAGLQMRDTVRSSATASLSVSFLPSPPLSPATASPPLPKSSLLTRTASPRPTSATMPP